MNMFSERKAASIKDVAALAKVSVSTVSRYLNDRSTVGSASQKRIANAISVLGYRPSAIARALGNGRLRSIAVFSSNTTLYGQVQTLQGIERAAQNAGYALSICVLNMQDRYGHEDTIRVYLDQNPAGAILLDFEVPLRSWLGMFPENMPMVAIAGGEFPMADVSLCSQDGGYEVTKYLFSLGHHSVRYVSIPNETGPFTRMEGWKRACREVDAFLHEPIIADWGYASGRKIGRQLGCQDDVTAVFGGNDEIAIGIIRGLRDVGRRVPEDVSVVGFDGNPVGEVWDPALTTICQDFAGAGAGAFAALHDKIEAGKTQNIYDDTATLRFPGHLVIRDSATTCSEI